MTWKNAQFFAENLQWKTINMVIWHKKWSINGVVKLMSLFFLGKKMTGDHLLYDQQKSGGGGTKGMVTRQGSTEDDFLFYPNETNNVHNSIFSLNCVTLASPACF